MYTVSMKCSPQERKALFLWLGKNGYWCDTTLNNEYNNEILIGCENKTFNFFKSVAGNIKTGPNHIECQNFTQVINVLKTIDGMPKYDCAASIEKTDLVDDGRLDIIIDNIVTDTREYTDEQHAVTPY